MFCTSRKLKPRLATERGPMRPTATRYSAEDLCLLASLEWKDRLISIGIPPGKIASDTPLGRVQIDPNDLRALCRPGVYIFWKGNQALYVGKGKRVINRMSTRNHGAVGRALRECTSVEILFFHDELAAMGQEGELIAYLQPLLNQRGLGSSFDE